MQWRRARTDVVDPCGCCGAPTAKGEVYARTRAGNVRCLTCATQIEPPPTAVEDDPEPPATVPDGVSHQASLGFPSAGELTRGRVARHLANRHRGAQ